MTCFGRQNGAALAVNSAMSNDLMVQPVATVRSASDAVGETRLVAVQPTPPPQPDHGANPSPIPNPSLRLDPALGLVVIEFRNHAGVVSRSIPSQRELAAYQKWAITHAGPALGKAQKPQEQEASAPATEPHATAPPAKETSATPQTSGTGARTADAGVPAPATTARTPEPGVPTPATASPTPATVVRK
jgi:hypothetical protein